MGKKDRFYENLLKDLNRGMVEGLEESYLEFKLQNPSLSQESLKSILYEIEKSYNVKFENILIHFPQPIGSLKISDIIKVLITFVQLKLNKPAKIAISPIQSSSKLNTIEFSNISFNDFMFRIDLCSDWITENLEKTEPKHLIRAVLAKCKIQPTEEELKVFGKELRKIFSADYDFGFPDFRALTFAWYQACHSSEDLRLKLIKTIGEFEEIKDQKIQDFEKTLVNDLINNLKIKLKEIPNYQIREENFENKCIEGIAQIFKFYSKQQFLIGKNPTFESIKVNTEVLNLGKFTQFCKDFQIIQGKNSKLTIQFAKIVFTQTAEFSRNMSENHFLQALEKIAEKFFDSNFDKENNTKWSQLPIGDKKIKLYEYLNFHRPEIYSAKLKGLIPHFGIEENERIPEYDLGKKYKPKPEKIKLAKLQVEEWKKKKIVERPLPKKPEKKGYSDRYQRMKVHKGPSVGSKGNPFISKKNLDFNESFSEF